MEMERAYIAIDLKSFYASVECVERGLDPLTTNLVVADKSRTEKTICLAVSPSLKAGGIAGRPRLFEVARRVRELNALRRGRAPGRCLSGSSSDARELAARPELAVDYLVAPPRMALYIAYSTRIYQTYLQYVAPEDIHVYSIDEVFIDATRYLKLYRATARELARRLIRAVLEETGVTATAGVAPNLYLSKVAMDIVAKHVEPDQYGARVAVLDERSYREKLWTHRPLTDFWRVGRGYARRLEAHGLFTMGDVARCSLQNEALLYKLFGVNAELLIDHAWGWEPCTIAAIRSYRPENMSVGSGQVLQRPYSFEEGRLIIREMADALALSLVERGLAAEQLALNIGYDRQNLADPERVKRWRGPVTADHYGRAVPAPAHGSENLPRRTASARLLTGAALSLYERIADPALLIRRLYLSAGRVCGAREAEEAQLDLFGGAAEEAALARETRMQRAVIGIKKKFGKNAIVRAMDLQEGATAIARNGQIGGHRE